MPYLYIYGSTSTGNCYCCQEPPECWLTMPTLLIDSTETPYADETTAQAAIDDQAYDCLLEAVAAATNRTSLTASLSGGQMTINEQLDDSPFVGGDSFVTRCYLTAANGLDYSYNVSVDSANVNYLIQLYEDDGTTLVDSFNDFDFMGSSISGSGNLAFSADGYHYVKIFVSSGPAITPSTSLTFSGTIDGGSGASYCPIRAAYDDGVGTSYLICA